MSSSIYPSRTLPLQARARHSRLHLARQSPAEERGLCSLEDYSYLAGESIAMRSLRAQLRRVSPHFRVALIAAEDGTGKETVALAMHRLRAESDATFYSHDAASLLAVFPELLARAEGRTASHPSPESALGTHFLAEAGELSHGEQMYLHQALRRLAASRHAGFKLRATLPRMIFATARDLRSLSGTGQFDRGLYRAISAVEVVLPPLRARTEDIPLITCGMLSRSSHAGGAAGVFDGHALSRLQCHDWPGNVRELESVVDLARQNAGDSVIEAIHLPPLGDFARTQNRTGPKSRPDIRIDRLEDVIQSHVLDVLVRCSGNKVRAAERLGISRSTLYRMLDAGAHERAG